MKTTSVLATMFVALCVAAAPANAHEDKQSAAKAGKFDATKVEEKAYGRAGDPKKVTRTIQLVMADSMRFTPADIVVRKGETVKFVVRNNGKVLHEMVLGTTEELKAHAALMKKFPEMEHADANMAHVKPSAKGEIVWRFSQPGEFQFACLIPGHFEAGMVGNVTVR